MATKKKKATRQNKRQLRAAKLKSVAKRIQSLEPLDTKLGKQVSAGSLRVEASAPRWDITANSSVSIQANDRSVAVFDVVGEIWEGSEVQFRERLRAFGTVDEIQVNINTPGGDYNASRSIFEALVSHPAFVVTRSVGQASSGGSIILQAGDRREVADTSSVMVHSVQPTPEQVRGFLDRIEQANEVMAMLFAGTNTAGKTQADIQEMFATGDHNMTAKVAVDEGFADSIVDVANRKKQKEHNAESGDVLTLGASSEGDALTSITVALSCLRRKRAGLPPVEPQTSQGDEVNFSRWLLENYGLNAETLTKKQRAKFESIFNAEQSQGDGAGGDAQSSDSQGGDAQGTSSETNNDEASANADAGNAVADASPAQGTQQTTNNAGGAGGSAVISGPSIDMRAMERQMRESMANTHTDVARITNGLSGHPQATISTAIREGWDDDRIELANFRRERENTPQDHRLLAGADYQHINVNRGADSYVDPEQVVPCAFARTLIGSNDFGYQACTNLYHDTSVTQREQLGANITNLPMYDDATWEAAGLLMRRANGGQIDIRHMACALLHGSTNAGFDIDQDLQNAFSNVTFLKWLKQQVNRAIVANFREQDFLYPSIVNVISANDYRPTKRYRVYNVGHMEEVKKGGTINHAELAESDAYTTELNRFAKILSIDECWIEQGDIGSIQDLLRGLAQMAARAPEEVLFDVINARHCTGVTNNTIEFTQEFWDAMWKVWCECTVHDPRDPSNESSCQRKVHLDGLRMQILVNKLDTLDAQRMLSGVVQVCGDNGKCLPVYTANLYGSLIQMITSSRLDCRGVVIMPQGNQNAPSHVMTVYNGIRVPTITRFDPPVNKLSIDLQAKWRFGIDEADEHLQKNGSDVHEYIANEDE